MEIPLDVWHAFHRVWTWAVDKPGYDKNYFIELERILLEMARAEK